MNHYAQALAELQAQPDHELKQIGDQWQTPKTLAWGLFHQFAPTLGPVVLDMFADDCNHLVPHYYDAEDNALTQELAADLRRLGGAAYANPPYSRPCTDSEGNPITGMEAILNYCREQRALGAGRQDHVAHQGRHQRNLVAGRCRLHPVHQRPYRL